MRPHSGPHAVSDSSGCFGFRTQIRLPHIDFPPYPVRLLQGKPFGIQPQVPALFSIGSCFSFRLAWAIV
jgi:hypothetical protein